MLFSLEATLVIFIDTNQGFNLYEINVSFYHYVGILTKLCH